MKSVCLSVTVWSDDRLLHDSDTVVSQPFSVHVLSYCVPEELRSGVNVDLKQ